MQSDILPHICVQYTAYMCDANQPTDSVCDGERKKEWERAHTQALPMDGLFARISGIIVCLLQMEKKINVCDELESAILSHICICLPTYAHTYSHAYTWMDICVCLLICTHPHCYHTTTDATNNNNSSNNTSNNRIYGECLSPEISMGTLLFSPNGNEFEFMYARVCVFLCKCTLYNSPALTIER